MHPSIRAALYHGSSVTTEVAPSSAVHLTFSAFTPGADAGRVEP